MKKHVFRTVSCLLVILAVNLPSEAAIIEFESPPAGPSYDINTSGGFTEHQFSFSGASSGLTITSTISGSSLSNNFLAFNADNVLKISRSVLFGAFMLDSLNADFFGGSGSGSLDFGGGAQSVSSSGATFNSIGVLSALNGGVYEVNITGLLLTGIDTISLSDVVAPAAVPEPASVLLLGLGACVMGARRLRRRNTVIA
jgi:hypothetical protein